MYETVACGPTVAGPEAIRHQSEAPWPLRMAKFGLSAVPVVLTTSSVMPVIPRWASVTVRMPRTLSRSGGEAAAATPTHRRAGATRPAASAGPCRPPAQPGEARLPGAGERGGRDGRGGGQPQRGHEQGVAVLGARREVERAPGQDGGGGAEPLDEEHEGGEQAEFEEHAAVGVEVQAVAAGREVVRDVHHALAVQDGALGEREEQAGKPRLGILDDEVGVAQQPGQGRDAGVAGDHGEGGPVAEFAAPYEIEARDEERGEEPRQLLGDAGGPRQTARSTPYRPRRPPAPVAGQWTTTGISSAPEMIAG